MSTPVLWLSRITVIHILHHKMFGLTVNSEFRYVVITPQVSCSTSFVCMSVSEQCTLYYSVSLWSETITTWRQTSLFSVLSCLVQEIWCKIHNLVMVESPAAAMAAVWLFCDGSISEKVQGPNFFFHTSSGLFSKDWHICVNHFKGCDWTKSYTTF